MSAIEAQPKGESRPACRRHLAVFHKAADAVVQCGRCEKWLHCVRHRGSGACRTQEVRWWNLRLQGRIKRYLARGDDDGEAEK